MVAPRFAAGPRRAVLRDSRLAALALLLSIPACYSWDRVELAPPPQFGPRATVRVELTDRSRVTFDGPRVVGDTLVGLPTGSRLPRAVALADVRRAQERRFSSDKTFLLTVGLLVAGGMALLYAAMQAE